MGKAERKITKVVTDEWILLYRRVTEVIMPNGKRRYPVDYFDATPGVVKVSKAERHKLSIPVYDIIIWFMASMSDGYYMLINKHSVKDTSEFAHKLADLVQIALIGDE